MPKLFKNFNRITNYSVAENFRGVEFSVPLLSFQWLTEIPFKPTKHTSNKIKLRKNNGIAAKIFGKKAVFKTSFARLEP